MYGYCFEFFQPGKRSFTNKEFFQTLNNLSEFDYDIKFRPNDPHIKQNSLEFRPHESNLNVEVAKKGRWMDLILHPAEGEFGTIGWLTIDEEQLQEQFKDEQAINGKILTEAGFAIFDSLKPYFAWCDHELELDKLEEGLRFNRVGAVAWSNLFSKEFIHRIGGLEKVIFRPEDPREKQRAQAMLNELGFYSLTLEGSPVGALSAPTALECRNRYPGAILKSFEVPARNAIEVW